MKLRKFKKLQAKAAQAEALPPAAATEPGAGDQATRPPRVDPVAALPSTAPDETAHRTEEDERTEIVETMYRAAQARVEAAEARERAAAERVAEADELARTAAERVAAAEVSERVASERLAATEARERAVAERLAATEARERAVTERLAATEARERAAAERDAIANERDRAAAERDALANQRERAAAERDTMVNARLAAMRDGGAGDGDYELERARLEAELQRAHLDSLTGAFRREMGRLALRNEIERARRGDGRFVMAFIDVDGLKQVNDRDGHAAGDRILRTLAATMRANLRSYDPIVRYGGDEFVCGISSIDASEVEHRIGVIDQSLRSTTGVGVSAGLAALTGGETLEELTAKADAALLEAKRSRG